jgi:hypothetical protein
VTIRRKRNRRDSQRVGEKKIFYVRSYTKHVTMQAIDSFSTYQRTKTYGTNYPCERKDIITLAIAQTNKAQTKKTENHCAATHERRTHERKIKMQSPKKLRTGYYVCNNCKIHSKDKAVKSLWDTNLAVVTK